ncbi:hypothetical protein FISHEDRAFT_70195 [Fistulina hepatica ATCC 64428]|uniref:Uncharacterized protein n=1 Tax=Fistulina hepatica ATCC 64428 TaxID=1128425 RepID=A0A0D7AJL8_9AGAR|nr:hypothetical protein FISHEDRAFT_70195 [Fistulina hepatica ATCC 64428]
MSVASSTHAGGFTEEVVRTYNGELTLMNAMELTDGRAIVATGSLFLLITPADGMQCRYSSHRF